MSKSLLSILPLHSFFSFSRYVIYWEVFCTDNTKEKSRPSLPSGAAFPLSSGHICDDGCSCCSTEGNCTKILDQLQEEVSSKFQSKKESGLILAHVYYELGLDARSARVSECATFLEFHVTETEKKLHTANFCRDRLCPGCNWRRSLKIFGQVSQVMDVLENQRFQFLFLTLTVKNCSASDLPCTVGKLLDGWSTLRHRKRFKTSVVGSFRSLEITRNKFDGSFHPHLHVILAVCPDYFAGRNYVPQSEWSKLWRSCCDLAYDPIVDIRKIKSDARGISGAVAEAAKYAAKDSDYLTGSFEDMKVSVSALFESISGRRLCSFCGCFDKVRKQLALDDPEDGDLVHVETDQFRDDVAYMVVRYFWRAGVYVTG